MGDKRRWPVASDVALLVDEFLDNSAVSDNCHGTATKFECVEPAILLGPFGEPILCHFHFFFFFFFLSSDGLPNVCVCVGNLMEVPNEWDSGRAWTVLLYIHHDN